jgi:hypothetical protein
MHAGCLLVQGRIVTVLPGSELNGCVISRVGTAAADLQAMFDDVITYQVRRAGALAGCRRDGDSVTKLPGALIALLLCLVPAAAARSYMVCMCGSALLAWRGIHSRCARHEGRCGGAARGAGAV